MCGGGGGGGGVCVYVCGVCVCVLSTFKFDGLAIYCTHGLPGAARRRSHVLVCKCPWCSSQQQNVFLYFLCMYFLVNVFPVYVFPGKCISWWIHD